MKPWRIRNKTIKIMFALYLMSIAKGKPLTVQEVMEYTNYSKVHAYKYKNVIEELFSMLISKNS